MIIIKPQVFSPEAIIKNDQKDSYFRFCTEYEFLYLVYQQQSSQLHEIGGMFMFAGEPRNGKAL